MLILGSHVPMQKPDNFKGSVKTALAMRANSFMVYSGAPKNTIRKEQDKSQIKEALELAFQNNLFCDNFVGHAPYIVNLANGDP
ncbi:Putative endonuclease IV, fragment [Candidatus Phytoplasma australiense]|uniref:Putative endonuclease IV n=2 Tax=Phytoplasma australiense TaxID=59748 RepID=B1VA10_PHYAS|nr:Putative endonuclease IV, fragment [Candidatus Phytoplasma australiense]AGL90156.1 putative endonuclease IV [Strawberry lethal yellows phytoplasma (CPA) str. NZSb11]CAM11782.1 Putative endonuclease IV, fragment [Candidatus Phytoplasma australiense]